MELIFKIPDEKIKVLNSLINQWRELQQELEEGPCYNTNQQFSIIDNQLIPNHVLLKYEGERHPFVYDGGLKLITDLFGTKEEADKHLYSLISSPVLPNGKRLPWNETFESYVYNTMTDEEVIEFWTHPHTSREVPTFTFVPQYGETTIAPKYHKGKIWNDHEFVRLSSSGTQRALLIRLLQILDIDQEFFIMMGKIGKKIGEMSLEFDRKKTVG